MTTSLPLYNHSSFTTPSNLSLDDVQASCSSYKTCDACRNASTFCHFCENDFQCHAIIRGCIIGMSTCHHLEDCLRKEPQYVGYGPPPSVVIAVLCLVVTLTCCLCGLSAICSIFLRRRRPKRVLKPKTATENDVSTSSDPLLSLEGDEELLVYEEHVDQQVMERLRNVHVPEERSRICSKQLGWRLVWISMLMGTTVFALMFYPRMPDYNVCNRQFDYESILHSLTGLSPKLEFEVLMSVINENRFGFQLESGRADIYHNQTWIGKWILNKTWEAKAGSISDVIAPIRLDPGYRESLSLLEDFERNTLVFRINASITGSIMWGKHKLYRISSSVPNIEFLVGAEYDRGLCKCTEYLTPQLIG